MNLTEEEKKEIYSQFKEAEEYLNVNKAKSAQKIYNELYLKVRTLFIVETKDERQKDS
jgi:hypothetical protein